MILGSSEKNGPGQKRKQQSHGNVPDLRPHTTSPIKICYHTTSLMVGFNVESFVFFFVKFTLRYGIIIYGCV